MGFTCNEVNSPAFKLKDEGLDVWLGNSRGNKYSRQHKTLNPNTDKEFWDFDWEEIGLYDTKATIDFILKKTGRPKLAYVGHSQGTTQMFFALSQNEAWFREKLSIFIALAPVT